MSLSTAPRKMMEYSFRSSYSVYKFPTRRSLRGMMVSIMDMFCTFG